MMLRTLLVIDDYGEMVFLQTLLKKLGIDVEGIQNLRSFDETLLSLNPEVLVATAKGKKINGVEIAEKLKRPRGTPKVILLAPDNLLDRYNSMGLKNVDIFAGSPVKPVEFLMSFGVVAGIQTDILIDKYQKIRAGQSLTEEEKRAGFQVFKTKAEGEKGSATQVIKGDAPQKSMEDSPSTGVNGQAQTTEGVRPAKPSTTLSDSDRKSQYREFLAQNRATSKFNGFDKEKVKQQHKEIRAKENPVELADLEEERQAFVAELFRRERS